MRMRSRLFSLSIKSLRKSACVGGLTIMSITPQSLRSSEPKMPTIKLNKRSSLRRRCKFFKSAWKTWRQFTA
jgi:hypothetical protein